MRSRTILLVHCLVALPAICMAQRTHQFEFRALDRSHATTFGLARAGRGGAWASFPAVGFEFDVGYQQPSATAGGAPATLSLGGGSLIFNFGNEKNLFYVLGGYSRLGFTDNPAYTFDDNAVHGGIGDRIFLNERVAIRLEGRALYSPNTNHTGGGWAAISSVRWAWRSSPARTRSMMRTAMRSPIRRTPAPTRPPAPRWTRKAARAIPTTMAFTTDLMPVPTRSRARKSMPAGVPRMPMATPSMTASTSARPRRRLSMSIQRLPDGQRSRRSARRRRQVSQHSRRDGSRYGGMPPESSTPTAME
jgi:hypothetical protein